MSILEDPPITAYRYSVVMTGLGFLYKADVPALGLETYGISPDHAFEMAEEASSLWAETALEDGEELPVETHPAEVRQIDI